MDRIYSDSWKHAAWPRCPPDIGARLTRDQFREIDALLAGLSPAELEQMRADAHFRTCLERHGEYLDRRARLLQLALAGCFAVSAIIGIGLTLPQ
jgi:hypothetical protein